MGIVIEEFISKLRYDVDPKKLDDFKNAAKDVVATFAKLSAAIAGAMSGMSAYMLKVNKGIVDIQNMSRALGVSYKFWDALSDNMEIAGFTANDLSKAIGYMSRNLGELKRGGEGAKIFQEAFQDLNLTIKDFEGKSVEDQFLTLTNALRDLGKEDVEKAFSVTKDFLQMRGLAGNRLVRFLTDSDRSLEQMIARTDQIDFMNDEAVDGARKFTQEWNDFTLVLVDSIRQRISGLVGGAVAPMLERFHKWIAVNKELIEIKITEWVDGIVRALKWFFGVVRNGYRIISRIIKFFGGFGNMIKILSMIIVAIPIAKLLMTIAALGSIGKVRKAITAFIAAKAPLMIIVALLIVAALAVDELITYFKGGDTILSKFGEKLGAMLSDLQDDLDGWIAGLFGVDLNTWQQRQARGFLNFQNRAVTAFDTIGKALSKGVKQWKDLVTGLNCQKLAGVFTLRLSLRSCGSKTKYPKQLISYLMGLER